MLARIAAGSDALGQVDGRPARAADAPHAAARAAGLAVRRDVPIAGHRYDLVLTAGADQLAVVVDDPAGDPDGRPLRTLLARLDVAGRSYAVRRVPAWRCLVEPAAVISDLTAESAPDDVRAPLATLDGISPAPGNRRFRAPQTG
jgi:hypothetical protein